MNLAPDFRFRPGRPAWFAVWAGALAWLIQPLYPLRPRLKVFLRINKPFKPNKTDASGQTTTYTYNSQGQVLTVTNAKGETTTYAYTSGFLTSVTGPQTGATVSFTYDGYGRVRTTTDLNGYVKTVDYDLLNRVTQVTYPDSTTEQKVYTNLDLTLSKDRQGRWTRCFYNAQDQLMAVVDPQGRVTNYDRCICGELKGLIDPLGHRTSWAQDLEGRTTSKTFADGSAYAYTYETHTSRLKTVTDPKSQTTTYAYNKDNTPSGITYADSTVAFSYDTAYKRLLGVTKTITATSVSYPTTYTYNPVYVSGTPITGGGKVATETGPLGSTAAIAYTYDELGRVTGTSINSVSSSTTFDSLGRMTGASNPLGSFTYGYAGITSRLTSLTYPTGQSTSYTYQTGSTQDYRLTDITNYSSGTTVLSKFDYTYNTVGTIATKQEQTDSNTPTVWTYGYDNANQLTSAVKTNTSTGAVLNQDYYGYDLGGNRLTEQQNLSVTQTSFNSLNQTTGASAGGPLQFTGTLSKPGTVTVGGTAATMDSSFENFSGIASVSTGTNNVPVIAMSASGYATTNNYQVIVPPGTSTTPVYDLNGNLTDNGNGQTYTWDAQNELLSITYSGGATSNFTYDALGHRIAIVEKDSGGTVTSTKQFVWLGNNPVEERDASNAVTKRFFPQGEQIGGTSYYYSRDHLGSVREMMDSSGTIQARYDYDPCGRVTKISGSLDSDFQYADYYEHAASGLNLTLFRAYDPNTAKWLSRDPLPDAEMSQGFNIYEYVHNEPISYNDPTGKCIFVYIGLGLVALATGLTIYWMHQTDKAATANAQQMQQNMDNTVNPNANQTQAANALASNTLDAPNPSLMAPAVNALTTAPGTLITGPPAGPGSGNADVTISLANTLYQNIINPPIIPTVSTSGSGSSTNSTSQSTPSH